MSTNGSLSHVDDYVGLSKSLNEIKEKYREQGGKGKLSQQVASSMQKSLEVLMKFKKLGGKAEC